MAALRMVPMQARKMRMHHASPADQQRLATILDRISRPYGSLIDLQPGGTLISAHGIKKLNCSTCPRRRGALARPKGPHAQDPRP